MCWEYTYAYLIQSSWYCFWSFILTHFTELSTSNEWAEHMQDHAFIRLCVLLHVKWCLIWKAKRKLSMIRSFLITHSY
jgi:hypothetical protein